MVESSDNLDAILRDWAKDKVQKVLVEVLNRYEKQREER